MNKKVGLRDVTLLRVPTRRDTFSVILDHDHVWEFLKVLGDAFTRRSKSTKWNPRKTNYVRNVDRIICGVSNWEIRIFTPSRSKRLFELVRKYCLEWHLSLYDRVNNYDSLNSPAEI